MGLGRGFFVWRGCRSVCVWMEKNTLFTMQGFYRKPGHVLHVQGGGAVSQRTHMDEDTLKARQHARE